MSAPNFSCSHNARHIYAYLANDQYNEYCEDYREQFDDEPADFDTWYQDEKDYIFEDLERIMSEKIECDYLDFTGMCGRNIYDGDEVASVRRSFTFAGYRFDYSLKISMEAGYYEGFKLDYDVDRMENQDYMPDAEGCRYMLQDLAGLKPGLAKMLAPKLARRFELEADRLGDDISDCLEISAQYVIEGTVASNGEGFYHIVERKAA